MHWWEREQENSMEEQEIYKQAAESWGIPLQRLMVIEECAELIHNIAKYFRGRCDDVDIMHEMVDVQLMINQMRAVIGREDEWNEYFAYKLDRVERRLKGEEQCRLINLKNQG